MGLSPAAAAAKQVQMRLKKPYQFGLAADVTWRRRLHASPSAKVTSQPAESPGVAGSQSTCPFRERTARQQARHLIRIFRNYLSLFCRPLAPDHQRRLISLKGRNNDRTNPGHDHRHR